MGGLCVLCPEARLLQVVVCGCVSQLHISRATIVFLKSVMRLA